MAKKIKWWEVGCVDENGIISHGGIKASLPVVSNWVRINMENDPDSTYCIVPADDNAITEEEWQAICEENCKEEV